MSDLNSVTNQLATNPDATVTPNTANTGAISP